MNLNVDGFRKIGLVGTVIIAFLTLFSKGVFTAPSERLVVIIIIGIITILYMYWNVETKRVNNGNAMDTKTFKIPRIDTDDLTK